MASDVIALALTGGGTAGHVLPHFAVVSNDDSPLKAPVDRGEVKIFYFGGLSGMERQIVSSNRPEWTYIPIRTGKLRRYFSLQNFLDPFNILFGFISALIAIRRYKIKCLFSKGGFVSAPVVWAAWLNRVPVVIHESDATPALATKLTIPFARRALVSFEETLSSIPVRFRAKVRVSGVPLRSDLFKSSRTSAYEFFGFDSNRPTLLVFGGSLGAEGLNRRFSDSIAELGRSWNIIHIVGKGKGFAVDGVPFYRQFEFLNSEMSLAYSIADVALCRAGASSIFELAAARIPMILVPLGLHQSRGDQIINAKLFSKKGWAVSCPEEELSKDRIIELVEELRTSGSDYRARLERAPGAESAARIAALLSSFLMTSKAVEPF
ncbi:MAG: UDP-N-acetylglucosamine--N-acetylmuramyl-(pentapeptide) pyrophosphoryl-undecaprenol N-acetylglucosamine transferase [Proteobacteria bacterium]|nr:UDP-N-acetylglucosamine--N-acetylmuramyl-(pentapeptide) pyrophosphoryl-undecaprenol N-acetylglucosamine transferase [Pseudomonadota bacterium]